MFVKYICSHVLPVLSDLANVEEGTDSKLDMLKLLAEISENNGLTSEEVKEPLDQVFQRLTVSSILVFIAHSVSYSV